MTVKIIIDGVDVSECVCRKDNIYNHCCCLNTKEEYGTEERLTSRYGCQYNPDCYYKQLKRKEQECEELRNLFEDPEVKMALTDVRTGEREVWRKLGNKAQKYKQALNAIEKLATIGEVHGLTDTQYVENFRLHQERILNIINKTKEK